MGDAAVIEINGVRLAFSTDSFVVQTAGVPPAARSATSPSTGP